MCTLPITGGGIMDYKANTPIYLQVIDDIKRRILTGEIKLGDKLPSTRELAVQYTVNPNTAARIYNELEQCGLCYTKRGLGTFVSEDVNLIDTLKAEISENCKPFLQLFLKYFYTYTIHKNQSIEAYFLCF